jgi:hypothetical protein
MTLYLSYAQSRTYSASQALFSSFTARNMLFSVQSNSPSFDTDLYAGSEGRTSYGINMHVYFGLLLTIQETAANIATLQLDRLEIAFTAGVQELASCFFTLLDGTSPSTRAACMVVSTNKLVIPKLPLLTVSQKWTIKVRGSFSASSVTYSTTIYTTTSSVEYTTTGTSSSLTPGGFSSTMLVSLSSQPDNKYTRYYF